MTAFAVLCERGGDATLENAKNGFGMLFWQLDRG
jgi:hypothetical protein